VFVASFSQAAQTRSRDAMATDCRFHLAAATFAQQSLSRCADLILLPPIAGARIASVARDDAQARGNSSNLGE